MFGEWHQNVSGTKVWETICFESSTNEMEGPVGTLLIYSLNKLTRSQKSNLLKIAKQWWAQNSFKTGIGSETTP